ncbi:hypothetical protein [Microcoleus vaginatus]|uniref:hypothetical protein n=1 Tax=Microcoleus vaginatus TaxID=119532 RepID=UPI00020D1074|nr:hypothetical protein MicvaDRAFT_3764 [Microcoleus vaginatus FGP-2]
MIKSTGYFGCLGFAVISAMTAYPCQAQTTVKSQINVNATQQITISESPNLANTSASLLWKNPNLSKSFTVSELNSTSPNSIPPITTPQNPSVRTNPLGCRFFTTPSMQQ